MRSSVFVTLGVFAAASFGAACSSGRASKGAESGQVATATAADYAPKHVRPKDPKTARVAVIALSDFHGWLLPLEPKGFDRYYGGIVNIASMIHHREGITPETGMILDNGDMWTGPTESTVLEGEPVIRAYNQLGLAAANIANHEFDFGLEVLKERVTEAKFPFLGANIVRAGTSESPPFVKPFVILERDGAKVGVIGLSYADTPKTTLAKHVADLEFKPYAETLTRVVPEARAAGAEAIVVLFHDTVDVVKATLEKMPDLDLDAVVAGQNHRKGEAVVHGTPIVNPGAFGRSYVRFDLEIDRGSKKVTKVDHKIVDVTGEIGAPADPPSPEMMSIVEEARQSAKKMSGEILGHLARPLPVGDFGDSPLGHMITDSWLSAVPNAEIAICNHGALRQPLPAGPVTLGDVLGVLPFENNLYVVKLTGKQLKEQLRINNPVVGGLTWKYKESKGARTVVSATDRLGRPIEDAKTYQVLINDFMYFGGDGFTFKDQDAAPDDTGLSLREPILRVLRAAQSGRRALDQRGGARGVKVKG